MIFNYLLSAPFGAQMKQIFWGGKSLGRVIVEVSGSQSDTPHLVGLLWSSDQPVA